MLSRSDCKGIIAAPVLPMLEGGEIDWECLPSYIEWLVQQRPTGLAVNMDAGEGHSLSKLERRRVLETYVEHVAGRCKVVAGVIANTVREAVELGLEAKSIGADAMVLFPPLPLFLGALLPDEMPYRFHRDVAEAVDMPMIVFQFPRGVGPDYPRTLLEKLGGIEQVVAIKDASFEALKLLEITDIMHAFPEPVSVLTGADQMLLEELLLGADGALIGFASTLTSEVVEMYEAVRDGRIEEAKAIWDRIGPLARYAWRPPFRDYRPRMKEVLVAQGIFRTAEVRAPLLPVSEAEKQRIKELARHAGAI
ncbi:MAG: dihydrodipicolinate synthase family protein [Alicyclobacillus sp.]|nr:dihydrodipicolinate synthase family protein [Alicyclobacillus sp.]